MSPKNPWLWVGGIIIIALIATSVWYNRAPQTSEEADMGNQLPGNEEVATPATSTTPPETEEPAASQPKPAAPKPAATTPKTGSAYEQAIETYQYRMQFVNCRGSAGLPGAGTLVVKKNVKFMLDNRDKKAHTFVFASRSYKVGGEQWLIQSIAKAGKYNITCDGGGAGTIQVED